MSVGQTMQKLQDITIWSHFQLPFSPIIPKRKILLPFSNSNCFPRQKLDFVTLFCVKKTNLKIVPTYFYLLPPPVLCMQARGLKEHGRNRITLFLHFGLLKFKYFTQMLKFVHFGQEASHSSLHRHMIHAVLINNKIPSRVVGYDKLPTLFLISACTYHRHWVVTLAAPPVTNVPHKIKVEKVDVNNFHLLWL